MTTQKLQVKKNKDNGKAFEQILFEAADKLRKNIDAARLLYDYEIYPDLYSIY